MKELTSKKQMQSILHRCQPDLKTERLTEQQLRKALDEYDNELYRQEIVKKLLLYCSRHLCCGINYKIVCRIPENCNNGNFESLSIKQLEKLLSKITTKTVFVICGDCRKPLGWKEGKGMSVISHGRCSKCYKTKMAEMDKQLKREGL